MREQYLTISVRVAESVFEEYALNKRPPEKVWADIMDMVQKAIKREFRGEIQAGEMEFSAEDWFDFPIERKALDIALARERGAYKA